MFLIGLASKVRIHLSLLLVYACLGTIRARAESYYVDFAAGNDAHLGNVEDKAWKHAPGDPQAGGKAASTSLKAGDLVQFRGGVVYRGSIAVTASGSPGKPVVFRGTGWGEGRAVVDGSEPVTGWRKCNSAADAYGNPLFANLYFAEVEAASPFLLNLHEQNPQSGEDEFLWVAQGPNPKDPFFNDRADSFHTVTRAHLTTTSIVSPEAFTSSDPAHFKGASVLLWVNPNFTKRYDILTYEPEDKKITFQDIGDGSLYPDKRDQYFAIQNSPHVIDQPGEYFVSEADGSGKRRLLLWPRSPERLDQRITRSMRNRGFDLGKQSHIQIEGFEIRKFAGAEKTSGNGISTAGRGVGRKGGYLLRGNRISHNMSGDRGYGGICLDDVVDAVVENNEVLWNKNHRGIFITGSENVLVRKNRIEHAGSTALAIYSGKRIQILENSISHIYATHANGITIYIASENVLVAGNVVTDATTAITFQDSGPLYFFNNVIDGGGKYKNVNEWPNTKRGPWTVGEIVFLNNTFANAEKNASLTLGADTAKSYVVINNILDGLSIKNEPQHKVTRSHNIYTGLIEGGKQEWQPGDGESIVENPAVLFVNPATLDFRPKPDGPSIGKGVEVSKYYPKDIFPDVDFKVIAGVTKPVNIGATGMFRSEAIAR